MVQIDFATLRGIVEERVLLRTRKSKIFQRMKIKLHKQQNCKVVNAKTILSVDQEWKTESIKSVEINMNVCGWKYLKNKGKLKDLAKKKGKMWLLDH